MLACLPFREERVTLTLTGFFVEQKIRQGSTDGGREPSRPRAEPAASRADRPSRAGREPIIYCIVCILYFWGERDGIIYCISVYYILYLLYFTLYYILYYVLYTPIRTENASKWLGISGVTKNETLDSSAVFFSRSGFLPPSGYSCSDITPSVR